MMDATPRDCGTCARSVVGGNALICGVVGEPTWLARSPLSVTSCGPEARCFLEPCAPDAPPPSSPRAELALLLRTIAYRIFAGRR